MDLEAEGMMCNSNVYDNFQVHSPLYPPLHTTRGPCSDVIFSLHRALPIEMSICIDIIDFDVDLIDRYHRSGIVGKCVHWVKMLAHLCIWMC